MRFRMAVVNSDRINKYDMIFPVATLESALSQSWSEGRPSCISHDLHRPAAWVFGHTLFLEPALARLTAMFHIPESASERKNLGKRWRWHLQNALFTGFYKEREALRVRIAQMLDGSETPSLLECAALTGPGLAKRVFPKIFHDRDQDGLIPLSRLRPVAPGVFEQDGLLLFAHQYFRRSLSRLNSLNTPFLARFQELMKVAGLNPRLALDPDTVGLAGTYNSPIELEYWWGPKFKEDLPAIEQGTTHHSASEEERYFYGISGTEFRWYRQDERPTFECEELRDIESFGVGEGLFGCRFVHSMLDSSSNLPTHLDGAIRMYTDETMIARMDTKLDKTGRDTIYTKLWRVDGGLALITWKELISDYFRDNHLIGEYFGGQEPSESDLPQLTQPKARNPLEKYLPGHMSKGEGIRLAVSYHHRSEKAATGRSVIALDSLHLGQTQFRYIEADTSEIFKLLRRAGESVEIPNGMRWVAFEDMTHNFPLVLHTGDTAVVLAEGTLTAVKQMISAWVAREEDRVASLGIGVQYEDRDVWFALAGHVYDLHLWFQCGESNLPTKAEELGSWVERAYSVICRSAPAVEDHPALGNLLQPSGLMRFGRRFLDPKDVTPVFDKQAGAIDVILKVARSQIELFDALQSRKVEVAPVWDLTRTKCSTCHKAYLECNCCKHLREAVQEVEKANLLGYFFTNRKA